MPQKTEVPFTDTPEAQIEETPEPTETPTPLPEKEKIAFFPSEDVPGITENLTRALASVCASDYECKNISSEEEIDTDTDFVIFAKEPTALSSLTQRFPQTRFIIVSGPESTSPGAWVIPYDEAFLPFLAGIATTSNAYDWRSVGLLPTDSVLMGTKAEEAFLNGGHYFCGSCKPSLAPYVSFPLVISLPSASSSDNWNAQIDEAQRSFVYTAFLSDEAVSEPVLQKLISLNMQIIGVSAPPAGLENNWLASISFDWTDTLLRIISRSLNGEAGGTQPLTLSIIPGALTEDFSDGKTILLQRAYADLLSGRLSPYTPTTEYNE